METFYTYAALTILALCQVTLFRFEHKPKQLCMNKVINLETLFGSN